MPWGIGGAADLSVLGEIELLELWVPELHEQRVSKRRGGLEKDDRVCQRPALTASSQLCRVCSKYFWYTLSL